MKFCVSHLDKFFFKDHVPVLHQPISSAAIKNITHQKEDVYVGFLRQVNLTHSQLLSPLGIRSETDSWRMEFRIILNSPHSAVMTVLGCNYAESVPRTSMTPLLFQNKFNSLETLTKRTHAQILKRYGENVLRIAFLWSSKALTLPAVNVNIGRSMMASFASGIFVHTAARTVIIAPDWKYRKTHQSKLRCYIRDNIFFCMWTCFPFGFYFQMQPCGKHRSTKQHRKVQNKNKTRHHYLISISEIINTGENHPSNPLI